MLLARADGLAEMLFSLLELGSEGAIALGETLRCVGFDVFEYLKLIEDVFEGQCRDFHVMYSFAEREKEGAISRLPLGLLRTECLRRCRPLPVLPAASACGRRSRR